MDTILPLKKEKQISDKFTSQTCDIFLWETKITGITDNKTVGLPSPDGSQDGKWYFPNSVVTKIVTQGIINGFRILQPW